MRIQSWPLPGASGVAVAPAQVEEAGEAHCQRGQFRHGPGAPQAVQPEEQGHDNQAQRAEDEHAEQGDQG